MKLGIKIIRLLTGETLISDVESLVNYFVLTDPMQIVLTKMNESGNGNDGTAKFDVYMTPWMNFTNDRVFTIPRSSILTIASADYGILADYKMSLKKQDDSLLTRHLDDIFENIEEDIDLIPPDMTDSGDSSHDGFDDDADDESNGNGSSH
jgi:hypothetical protein